jgi:hypothetical protein
VAINNNVISASLNQKAITADKLVDEYVLLAEFNQAIEDLER